MEALKLNKIDEVIVKGKDVYFKSNLSEWYHSFAGQFPMSEILDEMKY
jgi:hypothetical protein